MKFDQVHATALVVGISCIKIGQYGSIRLPDELLRSCTRCIALLMKDGLIKNKMQQRRYQQGRQGLGSQDGKV